MFVVAGRSSGSGIVSVLDPIKLRSLSEEALGSVCSTATEHKVRILPILGFYMSFDPISNVSFNSGGGVVALILLYK